VVSGVNRTELAAGPVRPVRPVRPPRPVSRRAAWTFTSQGLSSASNFLLTFLVLAAAPARELAAFSVCLTSYLLVAQLARYAVGIPLLVSGEEGEPGHRAAAGVAVAAGLAVAPALVAAASVWPPGAGMLVILAAAMPALLLQEALRHAAIGRGRPDLAARGDGLWLALQAVGAVALLAGADAPAAAELVAVWAGAGALSAVCLAGWLRARPALGVEPGRAWLRENVVVCRRAAGEFAVNSGSYYVLCYVLSGLAGAAQLGYLRAAQTLFGPASVVLLGGASLGVPESVRLRDDGRRLRRFALALSGGLAALALVCGAAVYAALPATGARFFPESWEAIRSIMPWLTLFGAAIGAGAGAVAGLRALGASRWVLVGRGVTGAAALAAGLPASAWFGARGTFAGLGLAECGLAVWAWRELRRRTGGRHG